MRSLVDRIVLGVVAGAAVLCVFAFNHNTHENPCRDGQIGTGGMCVTYAAGGTR